MRTEKEGTKRWHAQLLRNAARFFEENPEKWGQGLTHKGGKFCSAGIISFALRGNKLDNQRYAGYPSDVNRHFSVILQRRIIGKNDAGGQTPEVVVKMLRNTASRLEHGSSYEDAVVRG